MNRIVRNHYPASRLPEDLREGFSADAEVRVTIDVIAAPPSGRDDAGPFSRFRHLRRVNFGSDASVDAYVQGLRDDVTDDR